MVRDIWGYHVMLDGVGDPARVSDGKVIAEFAKVLVPAIGMVAFGEPQVLHFAEHNPKAAGYSLAQFIQTSLVSGHFVDATGEFFIDILSCKEFDDQVALRLVQQYFLCGNDFNMTWIERRAGMIPV